MIRPRPRRQVRGEDGRPSPAAARERRRGERRRAGHDVAFDVAAGAERRQQAVVDAGDGLLQVALEDAVELNALPRW